MQCLYYDVLERTHSESHSTRGMRFGKRAQNRGSQPSPMLFSLVATAPGSANEGVGNHSPTLAAICAVIKRAQSWNSELSLGLRTFTMAIGLPDTSTNRISSFYAGRPERQRIR